MRVCSFLLPATIIFAATTGAAVAAPVRTFAQFTQLPKKSASSKIVLLKNLDVVKTTSVTTRTPVFGPVRDKKGKVIGTRIVGYSSATTKSTLVTPRSEIYSTNGVSTAFATPIVNFNYIVPVQAPFLPVLVGPQKAFFSLESMSSVTPTKMMVGTSAIYTQIFGPGRISFTRTAPIQLYKAHHQPNGAARSNLLTISFNSAELVATGGGTIFSLLGSTPAQTLTYTSDFLNFDNATDYDFSLVMTAASSALSIAALDPTLTNVAGARTFNTTRADVTGGFAASAVPEPQNWALLIAGFGLVGVAARRRRTAVAA